MQVRTSSVTSGENPAEGRDVADAVTGAEDGTGSEAAAGAETETLATAAPSPSETEGGDENPAASTPDELGGDNGDPAATPPTETDRVVGSTAASSPAEIPPAPDAATAPPDAANIRAAAMTHARAVLDLCRLAGQPQLAGRFLVTDAGLDEVRAALLAVKAAAEPEIAAHHPQPGRPSAARPWGEIVARTFRLKG